jgi:hypothetical protein
MAIASQSHIQNTLQQYNHQDFGKTAITGYILRFCLSLFNFIVFFCSKFIPVRNNIQKGIKIRIVLEYDPFLSNPVWLEINSIFFFFFFFSSEG